MASNSEYEQQQFWKPLPWMSYKEWCFMQGYIKLDLSNFNPGDIINMGNISFILTSERFLKEIKDEK